MANHAHRRKDRPKPRPMTGLWAQLTEEQKAAFEKWVRLQREGDRLLREGDAAARTDPAESKRLLSQCRRVRTLAKAIE